MTTNTNTAINLNAILSSISSLINNFDFHALLLTIQSDKTTINNLAYTNCIIDNNNLVFTKSYDPDDYSGNNNNPHILTIDISTITQIINIGDFIYEIYTNTGKCITITAFID